MDDDEPTGQHTSTWAHQGIPDDAQKMGLDRHTVEGSMIAMAGSLDGARGVHKLVAWLLLVVLAGPALYSAGAWLLRLG